MPLFSDFHVLVVAAHPDDEILFAGAHLAGCRAVSIVHTTDGVTTRKSARRKGFRSRAAYAAARRGELHAALAAGGIEAACDCLGYRDQTLSYHLGEAAERLRALVEATRPDLVLTHAYEGGHLDHDATCFAVHEAMRHTADPVPIWEFAGYHVQNGRPARGAFPDDGRPSVRTRALDAAERETKRRMLACFETQRDIVARFSLDSESLRPAPDYDFAEPPFPGLLGYEITAANPEGRHWRAVACAERQTRGGPARGRARRLILKLRLWLAFKIARQRRKFA